MVYDKGSPIIWEGIYVFLKLEMFFILSGFYFTYLIKQSQVESNLGNIAMFAIEEGKEFSGVIVEPLKSRISGLFEVK